MNDEHEFSSEAMAAIESCRPDSDDASLPEVASVLAGESADRVNVRRRSIETIDRAMKSAVQQVAIPPGLAERILAGIAADSASQELLAGPADSEPTASLTQRVTDEAISRAAWRPSRRLVLASLVMAASFLVVVGIRAARQTLDPSDIQGLARDFYVSDDHATGLSSVPAETTLPVSISMVDGVRHVTLLERSGEAYELSGRGRVKGTLYAIPLGSLWGPKLLDLPFTPVPQSTLGLTVAAWQSETTAYVMIVKGDRAAFLSFFSQELA
jgi:hypothetical protein